MREISTSFISLRKAPHQHIKVGFSIHFFPLLHAINFDLLLVNLVICITEQFGLQGPESYLYTSKSGCLDVDGIDDVQDYQDTIVSDWLHY